MVPSFEASASSIYANTEVSTSLYENPNAVKAPPPYDPMIPEIRPIPVDDFGQYIAENHFSSNAGFKEHYKVCTYMYIYSIPV